MKSLKFRSNLKINIIWINVWINLWNITNEKWIESWYFTHEPIYINILFKCIQKNKKKHRGKKPKHVKVRKISQKLKKFICHPATQTYTHTHKKQKQTQHLHLSNYLRVLYYVCTLPMVQSNKKKKEENKTKNNFN